MSSFRKFTKDMGIISLTQLVMALQGLIILPIITKFLGAANYGIWAQLGATISLMTLIAGLGLPYTLVRFLAAEKDRKEIQEGVYSVLTLISALCLVIALILILFSGPIANFFQCQPFLIKILGFIILLECLSMVLLNIFRAFQEIRKYSFFATLEVLITVGLIAAAVFLGYGLLGAVISLLIAKIFIFLIIFPFILKKIGIKIPAFSKIKEYLHFGLPTVASNISYWVIQSSDRYLIGFYLGVLYVGYYAPAYAIGITINFFVAPFAFLLPAVLSKFFDENKTQEVKTYLKYSIKYFLMIAIPFVFGLSLLSKQLLIIFSTPEIASNSYFVVPFVGLSILLYGIYNIFTQIIVLFKKTKIIGAIWVAGALLNLGLNFIFIPRFGILGAAITTLIAYTLVFILTWYYSFKDFQFEIDWQFILKSILASVLMTLFIIWFSPTGILKTIIAIITGAIFYGILILLFKGICKKEIDFLKSFLKKG